MYEEFEVLTIRDLDFTDDRGKEVKGQQLWLIHSTDDKSWLGNEVIKVWIPDGHRAELDVAGLKRGDHVRIQWDRRGKPVTVELVS